jgi:hypothetical protein
LLLLLLSSFDYFLHVPSYQLFATCGTHNLHMQALQKEGVSAGAIQSLLSEVDRDNNCRIDYDEVCMQHKQMALLILTGSCLHIEVANVSQLLQEIFLQ